MLGARVPLRDWLKRSTGWKESAGRCRIFKGWSFSHNDQEWSDPRVTMSDGSKGSIFDALEDMNAEGLPRQNGWN
jgi:hypothetical protein